MKNNIFIIRMACAFYNYRWPEILSSGIMFFHGQRITIEEFNKQARLFRY